MTAATFKLVPVALTEATSRACDLYTCKGKGGEYAHVGVASGAGPLNGKVYHIYKDTDTGAMFARLPEDFWVRMELVRPAAPVAAPAPSEWVSVADRLPEPGVMVLVYTPPQPTDWPGTVRIDFDCIDPEDDDHASWTNHNEHYEHFCCVAKPEGSTGPSEKAPYTHWMPLPAAPGAQ